MIVALGRAVDEVQDVDERLDAAGRGELLVDDGGELALHDLLDLADDLRRGAVHHGDAHRDLALQLRREHRHAPSLPTRSRR